jgi:hypothetical protein
MSKVAERLVINSADTPTTLLQPGIRQNGLRLMVDSYKDAYVRPRLVTAILFDQFADIWRDETRIVGSSQQIFSHWAYHRIKGLGADIIPLVFQRLEAEPKLWLRALHELTGADPTPPWHSGQASKMVDDWRAWGRKNGYVP